ncbi:hypothetical protein ACFL6R_04445 [Gemmatimonadota bacterium]
MRRYGGIMVLLAAMALSGCMQMEMLVKVNSDGSGTIETTMGMSKATMGMMGEMPTADEDPFSEEAARSNTAEFGEGVTFLSAEKIDNDEMIGLRAIYEFDDINTVSATPAGGQEGMEAGAMEAVTFNFDPADGGTLTVIMPGDEPGEETDNEVDESGLGMMKGFLAGMKISMKLEIDAGIASINTSRSFVEGNVVTLFEIDFDTIAENDDNLLEFMKSSNSGSAIAGIDGVTYVDENPLVIGFGAGGGFPIWYAGIGVLLIGLVIGVVMAMKKK